MKASLFAASVLWLLMVPTVSAGEFLTDDALSCTGDGLIYVVADQCMHDGGSSAAGDSLEIYCHNGTARFCLSGEECRWREAPVGESDATCSNAGLDSEWMASAWCDEWSGFGYFTCSESEQIEFRQRTEAEKRRDREEGC